MEFTSRLPLIVSLILPYLYLDHTSASISLIVSALLILPYVYVSKHRKINLWSVLIISLGISILVYYYLPQYSWLTYSLFIFLNFVDWRLASALVPFVILEVAQAGMASPFLGSYPASVKIGGHDIISTLLPLLYIVLASGKSGLIGFTVPYIIALASFKISNYIPNPIMIKISTPLFVVIGTGVILNLARVKLRNVVRKTQGNKGSS